MKKNTFITIILAVLFLVSCKEEKKEVEGNHDHTITTEASTPKKKLSPHTSTMAMVGGAHIHIDYSSPGVRNRIIFGGLLPFNEVWQAGAHMATWIETDKDLEIDGKMIPKGRYGFFVIPSQEKWIVIFNKNWDQHGKDEYNEKEDVIRFQVNPSVSENIQEHLEYRVEKTDERSGTISLSWEKSSIRFSFNVIKE
jgi:DUF2911 family protein